MKRIFLAAVLPLTLNFSPDTRVFDPTLDDPALLAPRQKVEKNLGRIGLLTHRSLPQPTWSDRAWDHNRALMNERYMDREFTKIGSWPERREFASRYSVDYILSLSGEKRDRLIASLSPAEKYDLLMGTVDGGLAAANAALLDRDMDSRGRFPTWWGICEGSAAAALVSPEPVGRVDVWSEKYQVNVPFYAPDIKALVSLLWSSYNGYVRVPEIGSQCDNRDSDACFDTNPASLHAALHHFLGMGGGALVADVDATRVVWNHPLEGYETTYYPVDKGSRYETQNFREALVPVGSFRDSRRDLRSLGTAYVVGVKTKVFYGENVKDHPLEGSVPRLRLTMDLEYELEVDANLNLLGGEWLGKKRPDILWTIPRGTKPDTAGDLMLSQTTWDGASSLRGWESAARASARSMMPLRKVVEGLVKKSRE